MHRNRLLMCYSGWPQCIPKSAIRGCKTEASTALCSISALPFSEHHVKGGNWSIFTVFVMVLSSTELIYRFGPGLHSLPWGGDPDACTSTLVCPVLLHAHHPGAGQSGKDKTIGGFLNVAISLKAKSLWKGHTVGSNGRRDRQEVAFQNICTWPILHKTINLEYIYPTLFYFTTWTHHHHHREEWF